MEKLTTVELKQKYRQMMKTEIANLAPKDYRQFNEKIQDAFLQLDVVKNAEVIMIYYSIGNEVKTCKLIELMLADKKTVCLPICTPQKSLQAGKISNLTGLVKRPFNLYEPAPGSPIIEPSKIDLIVVPGLAFDRKGYRLGYGGGYFDRFLAKITLPTYKLGLSYDFQLIPDLPIEAHDIPIHGLLTEARMLNY